MTKVICSRQTTLRLRILAALAFSEFILFPEPTHLTRPFISQLLSIFLGACCCSSRFVKIKTVTLELLGKYEKL